MSERRYSQEDDLEPDLPNLSFPPCPECGGERVSMTCQDCKWVYERDEARGGENGKDDE